MADYYETLGISKGASDAEIKHAYRKLAQEYHPDKHGGDDTKFKDINQAYQVLSDLNKRQQYDQFGKTFDQAGAGGFGGADPFSDFARGFGGFSRGGASSFDFGDVFSDIFGFSGGRESRRVRGIDLEMTLHLTFLEAVFGIEKEISIQRKDSCVICSGSGAEKGTKLKTCSKCHGQGQIRITQRTILGNISTTSTCDSCSGRGKVPEKPCETCDGQGIKSQIKTIKVIVPPGIDDGQKIRLRGQGEVGYKGSDYGDLYVIIVVDPHKNLKRDGQDILSEVPVSFYQAALGTRVDVETVDGPVELKVPSGTQSGRVFRLRGKGVPYLQSKKRGDHLVVVHVVTPTKLTKKEKELFKKLADEKGELVDIEVGLWDKIKDQFE